MSVEEDALSLLRTFAAKLIQAAVRGFQQRQRFLRQVTLKVQPLHCTGPPIRCCSLCRGKVQSAFSDAGGGTAGTRLISTEQHLGFRRPGVIGADASSIYSTGT